MPIPQSYAMLQPLLELAADGKIHRLRDAADRLAQDFGLTEQERSERMPNGQDKIYYNLGWTRTCLKKAGLLEIPKRGEFRITERGQGVLADKPAKIDLKFLRQFDESSTDTPPDQVIDDPPDQVLHATYQTLRTTLAGELLDQIKQAPPEFFERLVVDVLVRMGYGGSRREAGEAVGRSGDEGIDGIIKEDRLGLDIIYLQAKRWESVVGRPEVQKFAGALQGKRARKGVFITTSSFSGEAEAYAAAIDTKVVLISGTQLAELMIDHGVGVTTEATYELKRIDADYFLDD